MDIQTHSEGLENAGTGHPLTSRLSGKEGKMGTHCAPRMTSKEQEKEPQAKTKEFFLGGSQKANNAPASTPAER